jgi:hypothetical protein
MMRVSEGSDMKKERLAKEICVCILYFIFGQEKFQQEEKRSRLSAFVH